jgi:uncharacterized protein (UPF0210 family)
MPSRIANCGIAASRKMTRMRIRSITVFTGKDTSSLDGCVQAAGTLTKTIKSRLIDAGFEVQTTRIALPPVGEWFGDGPAAALRDAAKRLESAAKAQEIDYVSMGPIPSERLAELPELLASTQTVFTSFAMTDANQNVLTGTLPAVAASVLAISRATPQGFGNLRFCASANCSAGTPFFPVAYSSAALHGTFALAMESADLALEACRAASSTSAAMDTLSFSIQAHSAKIENALGDALPGFGGFDWSLAPHPDESCSIGAALESLSGTTVGGWGTLTAVAALTRAIRRAKVKHVGFSGVFLPVLEDAVLARRAEDKSYDLQRLLLYSSVCGAGLDTIPLPGDVSADAIAALLGDVATLATVLNKPLTVRLMPVPGLVSGQRTPFDFPYLINTTPLELRGGAEKLLRDERLWLGIRDG